MKDKIITVACCDDCPFRGLDAYGFGGERLDTDICNIKEGDKAIFFNDDEMDANCPLINYSVTIQNKEE